MPSLVNKEKVPSSSTRKYCLVLRELLEGYQFQLVKHDCEILNKSVCTCYAKIRTIFYKYMILVQMRFGLCEVVCVVDSCVPEFFRLIDMEGYERMERCESRNGAK